jgi:hypothetical protein
MSRIVGGGPTTVALGVALVRSEERPPRLAAGPTAETCSRLALLPVPAPGRNSGGGPTTRLPPTDPGRRDLTVAASGTGGSAGLNAIRFGCADPFSLRSGGATIFCACSGATQILDGRPVEAFRFVPPATRPGLLPIAGNEGKGG